MGGSDIVFVIKKLKPRLQILNALPFGVSCCQISVIDPTISPTILGTTQYTSRFCYMSADTWA